MVSINTNLTSLIAQRSMTTSTTKLNQAIERLTTGCKINHAGDNAANYSISTNMSTQLSAYDIASDNISMGMDLLQTAQDTIAGMQARGSRLHALITQARNGTYGTDSLNAMTQEAQAIANEINRLYSTTEYNGISLYDRVSYIAADWLPKAGESGFIDESDPSIAAGLSGACGLTSDLSPVHNGFIDEVDCDTPEVIVTDPSQLATELSSAKTIIGIGNANSCGAC